jgi:hypothetical protein
MRLRFKDEEWVFRFNLTDYSKFSLLALDTVDAI